MNQKFLAKNAEISIAKFANINETNIKRISLRTQRFFYIDIS